MLKFWDKWHHFVWISIMANLTHMSVTLGCVLFIFPSSVPIPPIILPPSSWDNLNKQDPKWPPRCVVNWITHDMVKVSKINVGNISFASCVKCCTMVHHVALYYTIFHNVAKCCTILHQIAYHIILHYIALYYNILNHIASCCTILYHIAPSLGVLHHANLFGSHWYMTHVTHHTCPIVTLV